MDIATTPRVIAFPVNTVGRKALGGTASHRFLPNMRPLASVSSHMPPATPGERSDSPLPSTYAASKIDREEQGPYNTYGRRGPINSTGMSYAWRVSEVFTAAEFPVTPPEAAGPLDSGAQTIGSMRGNIRVFVSLKDKRYKAWVLSIVGDSPQWIAADSGFPHPESVAMEASTSARSSKTKLIGYKLNLRNPRVPSWVTEKTSKEHSCPSKALEWWNMDAPHAARFPVQLP